MKKGFTLLSSALASAPGEIDFEWRKWFVCYPKWPLIWLALAAAAVVLSLTHSRWCWFLSILFLALKWLYWIRVRDHFSSGDVCPGIVISLDPLLLAVGTDLAKGFLSYPVISIVKVPRRSLPKRDQIIGRRVATVALYGGINADAPIWDTVDPRPVGAATDNDEVCQQTFDRIPEELWEDFERWLASVPDRRIGLYQVPRPDGKPWESKHPIGLTHYDDAV